MPAATPVLAPQTITAPWTNTQGALCVSGSAAGENGHRRLLELELRRDGVPTAAGDEVVGEQLDRLRLRHGNPDFEQRHLYGFGHRYQDLCR